MKKIYKRLKKGDLMITTTFATTLFYSIFYPYVTKATMSIVTNNMVAFVQIVTCLSVVISGAIWNKKSEQLFPFYPHLCVIETIANIGLTICASATNSLICYYILDTFIYAIITRNIICGSIKLRAIRYPTEEEREHFDNNNSSANALATIIGSLIAIILNLKFSIKLLWLLIFGNTMDNILYIIIYRRTVKQRAS